MNGHLGKTCDIPVATNSSSTNVIQSTAGVHANFFTEHVLNIWNCLPEGVDFSSLSKFCRSTKRVDLSKSLKY